MLPLPAQAPPAGPRPHALRLLALALLGLLPLSLAACSGGDSPGGSGGGGSQPATSGTDDGARGGADVSDGTSGAEDDGPMVPIPYEGTKIVRVPMTTSGPNTLDPVAGSTTYDNRCCAQVYETLLQYKYLSRPDDLEPLLLAKMPEISDDGRTWTFELKEGVRFHDDECFPGGEGREVTTDDVFFSWKRLADPEYNHKNWWLIEDTIAGFDAYKEAQTERVDAGDAFDYDAPVEGLVKIDDRRFQVVLNVARKQFRWKLAMFQLSILPREAVEMYGRELAGHPVGTGPFMLENDDDWVRNKSIRFVKNPNYHECHFPSEWMPDDEEKGFHHYAGVRLPIIDEVQITFFVNSAPQWLEFKAGAMDFSTVPTDGFSEYFRDSDKELKLEFVLDGIDYVPVPLLDFIFRAFNMEDELVGGYEPEKRALRQAINLALDLNEMNETRYNGECVIYDGPIPPGLDGHPEGHIAPVSYRGQDLDAAREKLREAGYTIGEDGKVTDLPVIEYYTSRGTESEKIAEVTMRNLEKVGIVLNPHYVDFSELMSVVDNRKAPMFSFAWGSDYPDAENNLALFYGPNESPGSNHFNYQRDAYDAMYERIVTMDPGPERTAIYEQMRDMVIEDSPFAGSMARTRRYLIYPWLKNFKPTETFYNYMKYWDVDMEHEDRN